MLDTFLTILDVADKTTRLYDWVTGAKFGKEADRALDARRRDDPNLIKVSDHVVVDRRAREIITSRGSAELIDPRSLRELIDPVATAVSGTVFTSQIVETPQRLRDAFRSDPWALLDDIRPAHRQMTNDRPDWIPIAFWENGVEYVGYQKRRAIHAFGFDFVPGSEAGRATSTAAPPAAQGTGLVMASVMRVPQIGPGFDDLYRELWATFGASVEGNKAVVFGPKLKQSHLDKLSRYINFTPGETVFCFIDTSAFLSAGYRRGAA